GDSHDCGRADAGSDRRGRVPDSRTEAPDLAGLRPAARRAGPRRRLVAKDFLGQRLAGPQLIGGGL
ncbi:MAG: hypothetical protein AVDCRST_MAG07-441, partial [uncultured Frankineae bacterium]